VKPMRLLDGSKTEKKAEKGGDRAQGEQCYG
jgi:hypothetical protein